MSQKDNDKNRSSSPLPTLIRFDWAVKRLLRNKADYVVLEGFLSVILNKAIKIVGIKEGESNQEHSADKFNRVDIVVEDSHGEFMLIEIQTYSQPDYLLRMLYSVSKTISEHAVLGDDYITVRKVYHINVLYFPFGDGSDYVYYGSTEFKGIHSKEVLQLTKRQKKFFKRDTIKGLYPEYYIFCVEKFNDVAMNSLDEWVYYLKNDKIPDHFTAPGLEQAREKLRYDSLSDEEKLKYRQHIVQAGYEKNVINESFDSGKFEGRAEGRAEGAAERTRLENELEQKNQDLAQNAQALEAAQKLADDLAARIAELERLIIPDTPPRL